MRNLVPAKAHKALVIFWTVPSHHDVRLKVRLPLHLVGGGGCSPFGIVGGSVTFGPHMIPEEAEEKNWIMMTSSLVSTWFWIHVTQVPEGVESPHVQHGEQLSFGFREGQPVTQGLKRWDHQSLLSVSHVQLHYGPPAQGKHTVKRRRSYRATARGSHCQTTLWPLNCTTTLSYYRETHWSVITLMAIGLEAF